MPFLSVVFHRHVRYSLAWLVCLVLAGDRAYKAQHAFDNRPPDNPDRHRADGNNGHTQIDFGGQWVFGRMVAAGYADRLYDRNAQWQVVRAAYPQEAASPWVKRESFPRSPGVMLLDDDDPRHDADKLMSWFMGRDSTRWSEVGRAVALPYAAADPFTTVTLLTISKDKLTPELVSEVSQKQLGGPLYPPVHAFLYAPLTISNSPQTGYRVFQWLCLAVTFLAGYAVSVIACGRIWWPVATSAILLYPGYRAGLELGQNAIMTLAIIVCGWALAARNRDGWGGTVWGLLAFKPVWAAAFFLVPLLQGRWRFCGAMILTAAGLAAATVPFVGLQGWLDWLAVGKEGSALYLVNKNWIMLSRDLFGLPRRVLIDFNMPEVSRGSLSAAILGWLLWGTVFATTLLVTLRHADRRPTGLTTAFLALGAFLCCYRFMYYDVLLSFFGVALLFAKWEQFLPPSGRSGWAGLLDRWADAARSVPIMILALLFILENGLLRFEWEVEVPGLPGRMVGTGYQYPWDTGLILILWAWTGWKVTCRSYEPKSSPD